MKFFKILLLILTFGAAPISFANSVQSFDSFREEVARVSCDNKELGQAIAQHVQIVPTLLFHFGKREHLLGNVHLKTISPEVWSRYFRGNSPNVKQAPFRQGVYGCTHPYDCDTYADYQDPWMMAIKVKQECRKSEAVASLIGLTTDARTFSSPTLRARLLKCYKSSDLEYPKHVRAIDGAAYPRTDCENALEEFLETNHIKIVHDGISVRSWYLRDRDCIETIRGTAEEILDMLENLPTKSELLCAESARDPNTGREWKTVMGGSGVQRVLENARKNP